MEELNGNEGMVRVTNDKSRLGAMQRGVEKGKRKRYSPGQRT